MRLGYKHTDVGIIPETWEVAFIGDLATFVSGKGVRVSQLHQRSSDFHVPVFGGNGLAGYTNTALVSHPVVVVGRVGQKCGEVYLTEEPVWITDNALYPRSVSRKFDIQYFALALKAAELNDVKNRNDLPLLTQAILHAIQIPWAPDVSEQQAIAQAFRDIDALLAALEVTLVKKRRLKQATMQQLVTGQTRLPGFHREWEVKRLQQLGRTYAGLAGKTKSDFDDGSAQYITFLNVMNNVVIDSRRFERVHVRPSERQNSAAKGDLFFNGSSETPEEVGMCSVLLDDMSGVYLNSFCFGFRLENAKMANGLYLAHFFRSGEGRRLFRPLAQGATRHNLSKTALLATAFRLPRLSEQTAIAEVLSDMDAEIAALEARRDKTHLLKQAMMQELLTGRTRLV